MLLSLVEETTNLWQVTDKLLHIRPVPLVRVPNPGRSGVKPGDPSGERLSRPKYYIQVYRVWLITETNHIIMSLETTMPAEIQELPSWKPDIWKLQGTLPFLRR